MYIKGKSTPGFVQTAISSCRPQLRVCVPHAICTFWQAQRLWRACACGARWIVDAAAAATATAAEQPLSIVGVGRRLLPRTQCRTLARRALSLVRPGEGLEECSGHVTFLSVVLCESPALQFTVFSAILTEFSAQRPRSLVTCLGRYPLASRVGSGRRHTVVVAGRGGADGRRCSGQPGRAGRQRRRRGGCRGRGGRGGVALNGQGREGREP